MYTHPVGVRAVRVVESSGLGRIRLDPDVQKIYVKPTEPTLHDQSADWSRIQDELAAVAGDLDPSLEALRRLAAIGEDIGQGITVVIAGNRIVSVEPGDTTERGFGLAFDIGTTTVVGALMNLVTGEEVAVASGLNGQHIYGGDVISRMSVTMRGPEWVERLTQAVRSTVNDIIERCLEASGVARHEVYELTFVGNTVMEHLLVGRTLHASRIRRSCPPWLTRSQPRRPRLDLTFCRRPPCGSHQTWPATWRRHCGDDAEREPGAASRQRAGDRRWHHGEIVLQKGRELFATAAPAGPALRALRSRKACGRRPERSSACASRMMR